MFKRFRKQVATQVQEIVNPVPVAEKIRRIHNAFDIAGESALREANNILEQKADDELIKKAELLKSLGFTATAEVLSLNEKIKVLDEAKQKAAIIAKYSEKYPQYKFILKEQVSEICEKYGLVCGEANLYKGTIPDKNIQEIANFKVLPEDTYYEYRSFGHRTVVSGRHTYDRGNGYKKPFYICAPKKDMNMNGKKESGVFLVDDIPDPIVLHWLVDGYLIVSKWGLEGQDPTLVNEKMN